MVAIGSNPKES